MLVIIRSAKYCTLCYMLSILGKDTPKLQLQVGALLNLWLHYWNCVGAIYTSPLLSR